MHNNDQAFYRAKLLIEAFVNFISFYEFDISDFEADIVVFGDICKRYYKDVKRLHDFHGIEHIDSHKIAGYLTYWISKLKPISVQNKNCYKKYPNFCIYVNELFALYIATGRLISAKKGTSIILEGSFLDSFVYTLKYRPVTGDNLSLIYYLIEQGSNEKE